jgi:hypothetical protein
MQLKVMQEKFASFVVTTTNSSTHCFSLSAAHHANPS